MARGLDVLPFGDAAVLVRLRGARGTEGARRARALADAVGALRDSRSPLEEPVPAAASVLVPFDPLVLTAEQAAALIEPALMTIAGDPIADERVAAGLVAGERVAAKLIAGDAAPEPMSRQAGGLHELAVRYGGEHGPDLDALASEAGLSPREVVDLHAGTTYEVLFLGFAPGFAYLGGLPAPLQVPRLATPRPRVPAGSVAIAGDMTAVYPHTSAGGWRLLGRTDATLFDPGSARPARLRPGDRVRFVPAT